jgi:hypothetical protein
MTPAVLLALALLRPGAPQDRFDVREELQGLYDEISQATLQFASEADVDEFHAVLYTPDWVFVDEKGQKQTWPSVRALAVHALSAPPPDSMLQPIQRLAFHSDSLVADVTMITVQTIVDPTGQDGRPGGSREMTTTTPFRDTWVRVSNEWKLKSREQTGPSTVASQPSMSSARR